VIKEGKVREKERGMERESAIRAKREDYSAGETNVVLSKLGRGEGRDCINNRLNTTRSRDRDDGVAGSDRRKGESTFLGRVNLGPR
jgi:hypothetical protein